MKPMVDFKKQAGAVGICTEAGDTAGIRLGEDTDMTGHRIIGLKEPAEGQDAATKAYVDARIKALADKLGVTL